MKSVASTKVKVHWSQYLTYVKGGEEVLVTERGKPVARLLPVEGGGSEDARYNDLIRRGVLKAGRAGGISQDLLNKMPVVQIADEVIARVIEEEREDRL